MSEIEIDGVAHDVAPAVAALLQVVSEERDTLKIRLQLECQYGEELRVLAADDRIYIADGDRWLCRLGDMWEEADPPKGWKRKG